MRIAVLGTGTVGRALAGKLVAVGHEVMMGSRTAANEAANQWARGAGDGASAGTFADAAAFGELVVNATAGAGTLAALAAAADSSLDGKVLVDVSNAIDPTSGFPPTLAVVNDDSLAEQIQRAYPGARVVKTLNTITAALMVDPGRVPGHHTVFLSGNDADAKATVSGLLQSFGWAPEDILDLGDISTARGPEMYLALWLRLLRATGTPLVSVRVVTGS